MTRGLILKYGYLVPVYLLVSISFAQQLPIRKYTPKDGLGHSIVYFTTQTRDGALWFSTDNGLTRYDGKAFTNFTSKDGLQSNFIFGLQETDTALLISSFGAGIASYKYGKGFHVNRFHNNVQYPIAIHTNKEGLWVLGRTRMLYKLTQHGFKSFIIEDGKQYSILKMIELSTGEIYSAAHGIDRYNPVLDVFQSVPVKGLPNAISCNSLLEIPGHNLLVAADNAIYSVSLDNLTAKEVMKGNFYFLPECLFRDRAGNILITNNLGELWRFTPDLNYKELLLKGVVINHFFQDDLNNIWLSTYGRGVWCIPNLYVRSYETPAGIQLPDLLFDDNYRRIFIASPNMSVTMLHNGRIQRADVEYPVFKPSLITTITRRPGMKEYLIGTRNAAPTIYRCTGNLCDSIQVRTAVASLYKSISGEYWAGLRTGFVKIDTGFRKAESYAVFEKRFVRSISEDFSGNIMVGTDKGVYIADNNAWKILNQESGLINNYVNVIFADTLDRCHWIGTNEGISKYTDKNTIVNFDHPFSRYRCNSIVSDRNGIIWIATSNGLLMYDRNDFYLFNEEDGVPSDIYKLAYDKADDQLYILSSDNLTVIETEPFLKQQSPVIHGVITLNLLTDGVSIPCTSDELIFTTPRDYITLTFSVPHYKNIAGWQVYYRIDEGNWYITQNFSEINIQDVPFGDFRISIKVVDANNRESPLTTLRVHNPAPIYRKFWFQILSFFMMLGVVVVITKSIVDRLNRGKELQLQKEQQRIRLEQKVLRLQMNPHFLFNSLMAIQNAILKNETDNAVQYLSEFAKLTRLILENSRQEFILLEKEIETLRYYLDMQQLRFRRKFGYMISIEGEREAGAIKVPPMLSQPFIENSIEHGIIHSSKTGLIRMNYNIGKNRILFTVEDNGIGFHQSRNAKRSDEHRSLATMITLERLSKFYNGKPELASLNFEVMKDDKGNVTGTRVSFYLPLYR